MSEASSRLADQGRNELPRSGGQISRLKILLDQFTSPLIIILIIAGAISGLLGEVIDMTVIFITVAMNTIVGFVQEDKANEALKKLRAMVAYEAVVLRDGKKKQIPSEEVVVGDILFLQAGDKIQADGRIIDLSDFEVNESSLTGESEPSLKSTDVIKDKSGVGDQFNMAFRSTIVENGRATVLVTATGSNTEIGKIANLVKETKEDKTPLQIQLGKMSKMIAIIVVSISVGIFIFGSFFSSKSAEANLLEMFEVSVAIAVAAIPEGIVITLTVILAIGMRHIFKRRSLVRRLVAAETLGSVSVICTDKTGTITEGRMQATHILTSEDDLDFDEIRTLHVDKDPRHVDALFALRVGILCNDGVIENADGPEQTWKVIGDTTDTAFLTIGAKVGLQKEHLDSAVKRTAEIQFSSKKKYMATVHRVDHNSVMYVKGAPEVIFERVTNYDEKGRSKKLTSKQCEWFQAQLKSLTSRGLRVLAVAYKNDGVDANKIDENDVQNLTLIGLVGLSDPVRPDVKETIQLAHKAGIKTVMITGDHVQTARSIAKEIGLAHDKEMIFDGEKLERMSDEELQAAVGSVSIFARVDPIHKIRIVRAFQANEEVVAMTGDGVNDAPALKAADIGVALGSGTAVAKETADMVLLDDSYSTIVGAVEEGRGIYQNIKKVVLYLLSGSFAEVVLIGGSLLMGLPLAVLPVQILWVNIIEDAFPDMALAFDKGEKENMSEPPRKKHEPIIDREMKVMIAIITVVSNLILFGLFLYFLKVTGDIVRARTLMFVGLGVDSLIYIYAVRSMRRNVWHMNPFSNKYLNLALLFGWVMLISAVHIPIFQTLLRTVPIGLREWGIMLTFGIINLLLIEIVKGWFLVKNRGLARSG